MKIVLCCSGGMSTSLLVGKMRTAAIEKNIDVEIEATSKAEVVNFKNSATVVLLGPQIRFAKEEVFNELGGKIPVEVIDTLDYGTMNGKKVLDMALNLLK